MIKEQEISFDEEPQELIKILIQEGYIDQFDKKGYKINFFGERKSSEYLESLSSNYPIDENNIPEIQSHLESTEDTRNYILYIKYKNIYIGGLSIFDFQSKEGFGLYKYLNNPDNAFYLGQWEENQKSGKGFLKIDKNHLYIGNFVNNQMDGEGLYHNKQNNNYYFGSFNSSIFKKGLYCNIVKDIYYIGKFENNKKNDKYCVFFNYKKNRIFLGEIKNDVFIRGHIGFLTIKESEEELVLKIENIIYYNRNSSDDSNKIILKNSDEQFEEFIYTLIQTIDNIKNIFEKMNLFAELEETYNDDSYNNRIGRYNSYENEYSFENDFNENYNFYFDSLRENMNSIRLEEIKRYYKI